MKKKISFYFALAIIIGCSVAVLLVVYNYDLIPRVGEEEANRLTVPEEILPESPDEEEKLSGKEQTCISSGGTVTTAMCCKGTENFPNLCFLGACGCSLKNSHEIKICDCGEGKCFEGEKCIFNENKTADWKTYRNEEYGFEIKYPVDYPFNYKVMNESDSEVVFAPEYAIQYDEDYLYSEAIILVRVDYNPDGLTIEEFYDGNPGYNYFGKGGMVSPEFSYSAQVQIDIIGGKEVIIVSPAGTYGYEYYIISSFDGHLVRIHNRNEPPEISRLMFETFRFLE